MLLAQFLEEIEKHFLFNSLAAVLLLGELDPDVHETFEILLELHNHILFR